MAATFSSATFLPALNSGENFIKFRDTDGNIRHKVYNNTITSHYSHGINLIVKTEADSRDIVMQFSTDADATAAAISLKTVLNQIQNNFNVHKNSSFSDLSFEIYNDTNNTNFVNFDLGNLIAPQTMTFGTGSLLITDDELNAIQNTTDQFRFFDHFVTPSVLQVTSFNNVSNDSTSYGVVGIQTITPGASSIWSGFNNLKLNNSVVFSVRIKAAPYSDTKLCVGFFDTLNISSITKSAMFVYDYTISNNWLVKTSDSLSTLQNTMTTVDANWHMLDIYYDKVSQSLKFAIDTIVVATINSNIPMTLGSEVGFGISVDKTSTAQTDLFVDYVKCNIDLILKK